MIVIVTKHRYPTSIGVKNTQEKLKRKTKSMDVNHVMRVGKNNCRPRAGHFTSSQGNILLACSGLRVYFADVLRYTQHPRNNKYRGHHSTLGSHSATAIVRQPSRLDSQTHIKRNDSSEVPPSPSSPLIGPHVVLPYWSLEIFTAKPDLSETEVKPT